MPDFDYYEYKGNIYSIRETMKMKCTKTRQWIDAIVYSPVTKEKPKYYVRNAVEFYKKFKGFKCGSEYEGRRGH